MSNDLKEPSCDVSEATCEQKNIEELDVNTNESTKQGKYPKIVFIIILNELCERFSFYGFRTILYIFLTSFIKLEKDTATAVYHAFTTMCYFTPIIGAILADGYIGLYKTILYISLVYCCGNAILSLTTMKPLGAPSLIGPAIGLIIIAIGTGGIKPCVSAFGGNQFKSHQKKYLHTFFSMFYLSINVGSTIGTILTPIFRSDVKCFDNDCYPLAFGVPALFTLIATLLFLIGTPFYRRDNDKAKDSHNIITQTIGCIFSALVNRIKKWRSNDDLHMEKNNTQLTMIKKSEKIESKSIRKHWIDFADSSKYSESLRNDVKAFCHVFLVFLPLPLFWAVYDQQGSRWTEQARQLDGRVGDSFIIKPDQFQAVNPIFIVVLVPLFDTLIYPLMGKCGLLKRLLQRMGVALLFAILSFLISAFLEWQMQQAFAHRNPNQQIKLFNALPCKLQLFDAANKSHVILDMDEPNVNANRVYHLTRDDLDYMFDNVANNRTFRIVKVNGECSFTTRGSNVNTTNLYTFRDLDLKLSTEHELNTLVIYASSLNNDTMMIDRLETYEIPFSLANRDIGFSQIRLLEFDSGFSGANLSLINTMLLRPSLSNRVVIYDKLDLHRLDSSNDVSGLSFESMSHYTSVDYGLYDFAVDGLHISNASTGSTIRLLNNVNIMLETCASYTILLFEHPALRQLAFVQLTDVYASGVHLAWQIPQIFVLTIAEIMFSISGITFAYSQAPASMKSVMQAMWFLAIAVGNLVVVVVAESKFISNQVIEYLLFVGLLILALAFFLLIAFFYEYVEDKKNDKSHELDGHFETVDEQINL